MSASKYKSKKQTLQDEVDQLITWYEENKPAAGKVIQVERPFDELAAFATEIDGKLWYRGRQLEATGRKASAKGVESRKKGRSMTDAFRKVWQP